MPNNPWSDAENQYKFHFSLTSFATLNRYLNAHLFEYRRWCWVGMAGRLAPINRISGQQNICSRPFSSPPLHPFRFISGGGSPSQIRSEQEIVHTSQQVGLSAIFLPNGETSSFRRVGWKYMRPSVTCQEHIRMPWKEHSAKCISSSHFTFTSLSVAGKLRHPDLQGVTGTNLFTTNKQRNRTGSRCGLNYHTFRRVITLHISAASSCMWIVKLLIMGEYVLCAPRRRMKLRQGRRARERAASVIVVVENENENHVLVNSTHFQIFFIRARAEEPTTMMMMMTRRSGTGAWVECCAAEGDGVYRIDPYYDSYKFV